jgi:hypothetical protein
MKSLRCLALLVMVFAFVGPGSFHQPQSASAASCSGTGCNGKDPGETQCNDASSYTVRSTTMTFEGGRVRFTARLELRYSPTCGTNWAKATITSANTSSLPSLTVELRDTADYGLSGTRWSVVGNYVYGNMWYAPTTPIKACGYIAFGGPGPWVCTTFG